MPVVAAIGILCVSCRKDSPAKPVELDDFIRKQECGLVGYGGYLFKYSDDECQLSINARRRQIRMQNDMQTDYVHLEFSRMPQVGEGSISVGMRYRVGADEIYSAGTMEIVRASENMVWLWDGHKSMGVIIPVGK